MSLSNNFPAIKPSLNLDFANVKALDPRITFARTTTATYYDGVTTAKAEENLLKYSQAFTDASWTDTDCTVTDNDATAPDGTSTAATMLATNANAVLTQGYTAIAGSYTFSVWLRRVTGTGDIEIAADNGTWTTKVITGTWARYDVTQTVAAGSKTAGVRVVTDTDEIEVWGAQLEQRSAVTAYTPTTTQPITNYIPVLQTAASGVARFDHNPTTGESLGLLVEEQRTNSILQSEDFSTTWTNANSSEQTNIIVSPAGTLTGDKVIAAATSNVHTMRQTFSWTASTTYTFSIYAKKAEQTFLRVQCFISGVGDATLFVNLDTGAVTTSNNTWTVGSSSATLVGNGWYRCVITFTVGATGGAGNVDVGGTTASGTTTYTGDGYSGIFLWGAQLEAGAFPTSYIATTSASVTRNADAASMTGTNFSSWYNAGVGTMCCDWSVEYSIAGNRGPWWLSQAGVNLRGIGLYHASASANRVVYRDLSGSLFETSSFGGITYPYTRSVAAAFSNTLISASDNGETTPATGTSSTVGNFQPNTLNIGESRVSGSNTGPINGHIAKLAYYPFRLTDVQLAALTS